MELNKRVSIININKKNNKTQNAEEVVLDIMKHFGFRRNYQVAKYFNVTPQTLSGWIKSGEIPSKHIMKYELEINNENINKGQTELLQKKEGISREKK